MVVIKKKENVIPVIFDDNFKLEITMNDEKAKEIVESAGKYKDKFNEIKADEPVYQAKELIMEVWDLFFPKGTGEKVFDFANESTALSFDYWIQAIDGVINEWNGLRSDDIINKYIPK